MADRSSGSSRRLVEAYARAFAEGFEAQSAYLHPDVIEEFPQSGERFAGRERRLEMLKAWPQVDRMRADMPTLVGSEDQWVLMPTFSPLQVVGTGDKYTGVGTVTYPNGEVWQLVQLLRLREGKIAHITSYFAAPFEPAAWRAPYREAPTS